MSIAHILSELALTAKATDIPQTSYDAATRMLLDTIGCACAGAYAPGINELVQLEEEIGAGGPASAFFRKKKMALPSAVFCNAAMIHAMDFDDNFPAADIHILSIVVPIALACAEAERRNGRDCLSAMILGVEVAGRIAKPYIKAKRQHPYFLTTSLIGGWGGVVTAARLRSLTVRQTVNAMGIYYAHTCGNRQALLEKKLTKRIQPAIAAKAASYSVMLARKDFTGPDHVFEGTGGFYRCYTQDYPPDEELFREFPETFCIEELVVKQFPTCGIHHGCIASALILKHKYDLKQADIERVEFFLKEGGSTLVSMPFSEDSMPQISAQFCAPYAIALALSKGEVNVRDFSNEAILRDHDTISLAKRTVEVSRFVDLGLKEYCIPQANHTYLKVYLRNHKTLEYGYSQEAFYDPSAMDMSQVEKKVRQCVSVHNTLKANSINQVIDVVNRFQEMEDVCRLISILQ